MTVDVVDDFEIIHVDGNDHRRFSRVRTQVLVDGDVAALSVEYACQRICLADEAETLISLPEPCNDECGDEACPCGNEEQPEVHPSACRMHDEAPFVPIDGAGGLDRAPCIDRPVRRVLIRVDQSVLGLTIAFSHQRIDDAHLVEAVDIRLVDELVLVDCYHDVAPEGFIGSPVHENRTDDCHTRRAVCHRNAGFNDDDILRSSISCALGKLVLSEKVETGKHTAALRIDWAHLSVRRRLDLYFTQRLAHRVEVEITHVIPRGKSPVLHQMVLDGR